MFQAKSLPVITAACMLLCMGALRAPAQVIGNVTMNVTNDEDSGMVGYWALDNYTKTITVSNPAPGSYSAVVAYNGTWQTFQGALSPEYGVPEGGNASGPMVGGYTATFNATSTTLPVSGSLGTFNFGGTESDILKGTYAHQTGDPGPIYDWISSNFSNVTNFAMPTWSWSYYYPNQNNPSQMWTNALAGSQGDIEVPEPGSLSMLAGMGLSGLGLFFRRRMVKVI